MLQVVSGLLIASLCLTSCWAQYSADYDGSYDGSYRGAETQYEEPRGAYRGDDVPAESVERASPAVAPHAAPTYAVHGAYAPAPAFAPAPGYFPSSDSSSYRLYHRDGPQVQVEQLQDEAPQHDHKHHHSHDHGTSSMSFCKCLKYPQTLQIPHMPDSKSSKP